MYMTSTKYSERKDKPVEIHVDKSFILKGYGNAYIKTVFTGKEQAFVVLFEGVKNGLIIDALSFEENPKQ